VVEGIEVMVFRTVGDLWSLFEAVLRPELLRLPDELARVDAVLDDPAFFVPFRAVLRSTDRAAIDADGDRSAVDVCEVPLPAGLMKAGAGRCRTRLPGGVCAGSRWWGRCRIRRR
jgi:IS5 family transposase